jgi:hypothetical protein
MKKIYGLIMLLVFIAVSASIVFAKTAEEELSTVSQYLHELDTKINDAKKEKPSNASVERIKKLRAEKNATVARMKKLKAEINPPQASPVVEKVIIEKERVIMLPPPPNGGSFGWGILTDISVGYIAGNSAANIRANWVIPSVFHPKLEYKVGLGYVQGPDLNNKNIKAIPVYLGGNFILPISFPFETYATGGLNYVAYGSGKKAGSLGGDIGLGIRGDIGLGQPSFIDVGWSCVHDSGSYSARGLSINAGTQWMF